MRESKIEKEVSRYAKGKGWLVYKFSSPGQRGVPDKIFMKDGVMFLIEFKATGKHLRKLQERIADRIMNLGGFKVYKAPKSIEDGKLIIDGYERNSNNQYPRM